MPFPLIFIAIAAGTGALGIGKSVKAGVDTHKAKGINASANDLIDSAKRSLETARKNSSDAIQNLGKKKAEVLSQSVTYFVKEFEKIKYVDFQKSVGLNELSKFKVDKQSFKQLKEMGGFATSILGGVAGGTFGGALTAFGAYGAAGSLAAASTGTAITTLSGAAATNATLAFFGGGSLATGGLGIAGGTAVLGGLVAGPALAIMGFIVGAKASKAKDEALANYAQAQKISSELNLAVVLCNAISRRANMFSSLLNELDLRFGPIITAMKDIIADYGTDYRKYPKEAKQTIAAAATMAGTIKAVIDTPILTEDGNLTEESLQMYKEVKSCAVPENKQDIIDLFTAEDRAGFVGNISWDSIHKASKICNLPTENYIIYLNRCFHYGTAYFVVTIDAIAYAHEKGNAVEASYYIPFSAVKSFDISYDDDDKVNGISVTYAEGGKDKGVLFTTNEIGDDITDINKAEHFIKLLELAACIV